MTTTTATTTTTTTDTPAKSKDLSLLRSLIDARDRAVQKSRIAFSNRLSAVDAGRDETDAVGHDMLTYYLQQFEAMETQLNSDIESLAADVPIIRDMTQVRGVGPMLAARVVAVVDISIPSTVSGLWRFAGYGVGLDGLRERSVKGEKNHYNARLKTVCWLIGSSFLKCSSPYRAVYDSSRAYYDAERPDWTKAHKHNAALRRMVKLWLSHLWHHWRTLEGLPTNAPYVFDRLGHRHELSGQDFGWPTPGEEAKRPRSRTKRNGKA